MKRTLREIGEFGLIREIRALLAAEGILSRPPLLGPGDDCAAFAPSPGREILVTCDSLVEGRHFLWSCFTPQEIGRRAMAVNLSDIGAMGGVPLHATVSLGLPDNMAPDAVLDIYRGFLWELAPMEASILGGNITSVPGPLFLDITLIGEVERKALVTRSGAAPGDVVLLTGYPGLAALGLACLRKEVPAGPSASAAVAAYKTPAHRGREGRQAALTGVVTAMIDTSDGFLGDLLHICEASGVAVELSREDIPVAPPLCEVCTAMGTDPCAWILGPSDDYELLLTCNPDAAGDIKDAIHRVGDVPVTEVGRVVAGRPRIWMVGPKGQKRSVTPGGWDHFARYP